jgi:hypothetical protein
VERDKLALAAEQKGMVLSHFDKNSTRPSLSAYYQIGAIRLEAMEVLLVG